MAAFAELSAFNGNWKDSLGNDVRVWDSGASTQVCLAKPGGGKEIVLTIKKVAPGAFICGHYDFDATQSSWAEVVWRDKRQREKVTVWRRCDQAQPTQAAWAAAPAPPGLAPPAAPVPAPPAAGIMPWQQPQPQQVPQVQVAAPWAMAAAVPNGHQQAPGGCGCAWAAPGQAMVAAWPVQAPVAAVPQVVQAVGQPQPLSVQPPPPPPLGGQGVQVPPPPPANPTPPWAAQRAGGAVAAPAPAVVVPPWQSGAATAGAGQAAAPWNAPQAVPAAPAAPPAPPADDWSHVLSVLAAARDDPADASSGAANTAAAGIAGGAAAAAQGSEAPAGSERLKANVDPDDDKEAGAARWSEVLELLAAAGGPGDSGAGGGSAGASGAGGGQIDTLFSGFGIPQQQPVLEQASEEVRAQVLQETLAQLLAQKTGFQPGGSGASSTGGSAAAGARTVPPPPWGRAPGGGAGVGPGGEGQEAGGGDWDAAGDVPDWQRAGRTSAGGAVAPKALAAPRREVIGGAAAAGETGKPEGPLDKFIRVFNLDELASKCLRALEDDEVAFVIESCQGRLRYARNPSAVVMTSIKGVAARVGRRYYGSRYNSELQRLLEAHALGSNAVKKDNGDLQFFCGSPSPEADGAAEAVSDPYAIMDLEAEEQAATEESEKRKGATKAADEPAEKKLRVEILEECGVVEVPAGSPEKDEEEDDDAGLFFVDTGG
eukprot:TRINITY_DN71160_c0_g1_i1.p1 TRINITY_DN71160_c0_g1~~TRINITY_DN71160_c0_g1_i1.p1  ORF type:complete len:711 (+),score=163.04 TRINITY_DN71160_c0_g1_i1:176-2308(+)